MDNLNHYEVKFNPGFMIKIFTGDYEREYYTCINQLVSILYVDPYTGYLKVCRGRIDKYLCSHSSYVVDNTNNHKRESFEKDITEIVLDTSKAGKSSSFTIDITAILEINPIDWRYNNLDSNDKPLTFEDWYELNKRVSAPSSAREDRVNASKKSSVH